MSEREWRFYIDDMIAFAERVLDYTKGLDDIVWSIVQDDIPAPLTELRRLKAGKQSGG